MPEDTDAIDTWGTDEIVCPWCGHVFGDSWEYNYDDDLVQCPECEKTLELEIEYNVSYYTQKPDWLEQWRRWNNRKVSNRLCEIARQEAQKHGTQEVDCQCTNLDERWRCDVCGHTWFGRLSDCPICGAGVDEHVWIVKVAL